MVNLEKLILLLEENHFIIVLLFFLELFAIIIALKNLRSQYLGRLFIIYLSLDALLICTDILLFSTPSIRSSFKLKFLTITNTIIGVTELLVYYSYFKQILEGKKIKWLIVNIQRLIIVLAISVILFTIISPYKDSEYTANLLGVLELLLFIPPSIFYFQKILNTESNLRLFSRPSFWITSGVFFYSASAIPYYLIKKYLDSIHNPYRFDIATAFYYTPIIINVIFLIFAFRWKKPITI